MSNTALDDWVSVALSNSYKMFESNLISEFYKLGMTLYNQRYDIFELLYAFPDGENVFSFSVGENIKDNYIEYLGGEIDYCLDCNSEFIKNSQRHKLCKNCYNKRQKDSKREWWNNKIKSLDQ